MIIGVDTLPELPKDVTDRNRTSPFAFTGNKFEFRAVGSTQSCAGPNIALNTIVAEAFDEISTELEKVRECSGDFNSTQQKILKKIIEEHKKIVFNGDNYSSEWLHEAERRGLPNIANVPDALKAIVSKKSIALYTKYKVLSRNELLSRKEIFTEEYAKIITIEGKLALDIAKTMIFPAAIKYMSVILDSLTKLNDLGVNSGTESLRKQIDKIGGLVDDLATKINLIDTNLQTESSEEIVHSLKELRTTVDALEREVDDSVWPLPKYSEMLFIL